MTVSRNKLEKLGDGTGILLAEAQLQQAGLRSGDEVVVQVERGRVVITRLDPEFDEMVEAADRFVSKYPNALRKLGE